MPKDDRDLLQNIERFGKQISDEQVDRFLDYMGHDTSKPLPFLGGGAFATAFWMSDKKKVLKVTTDAADAYGLEIFRKRPMREAVRVYKVVEVEGSKGRSPIFAAVVEKLQDISDSEYEAIASFDTACERLAPDIWKYIRNAGWKQAAVEELDARLADIWVGDEFDFIFNWLYDAIPQLEQRKIRWKDFHEGNVLARGRDLCIVDIGYATIPTQKLPIYDLAAS
jgi:hypothetical protein